MAKDYVKSRKHEWLTACFIPDVTDLEHATTVVARMVELQDDSLNGGIVLRRYKDYQQADERTVEARVWWVDGEPDHGDRTSRHTQPAHRTGDGDDRYEAVSCYRGCRR